MGFVESLRASRESKTVSHLSFLHSQKNLGLTLHSFFEGKDDPSFYNNFLHNRFYGRYNLHNHICNNKKNVLYEYEKAKKKRTQNELLLFFVDKDFSDLLGESLPKCPHLFVTKYYSIENYLVNSQILMRMCTDYYSVVEDELLKSIDGFFEESYHQFVRKISPVIKWIVLQKRQGTQINLCNLNISDLLFINSNFDVVSKDVDRLEILSAVCPEGVQGMEISEYRNVHRTMDSMHCKGYIRGKFDAWFLIEFIKSIHAYLRVQGVQIKDRLNLGHKNFVISLGPLLVEPDDIATFLGVFN